MDNEIKKFLSDMFPNINVVKIVVDGNWISVYFDGFDNEQNSAIRKKIIVSLATQLAKKLPKFHFHVAHITRGLT